MRTVFSRLMKITVSLFLLFILGGVLALTSKADNLDSLKQKIETKNEEIRKLEEEERKIIQNLVYKQETSTTLKTELNRIERDLKRLRSEISINKKRIARTSLEIDSLALEVQDKEQEIQNQRQGLASLLQVVSETDKNSLLEVLLQNNFLSDFFSYLNSLDLFKRKLLVSIGNLRTLQGELAVKKQQAEDKKNNLSSLEEQLSDKKNIQEGEKQRRSEVLKITKNQEKLYQKLLTETRKREEELQREITDFERQLNATFNVDLLPKTGQGVLGWPLKDLSLISCRGLISFRDSLNCITQFFGNTSFALAGAYNGRGHNGVDFRAPVGTPVYAAEDGTIRGWGDTDAQCRKASYGKWILIDHPNNLSTLYAHLAEVKVAVGQNVRRGDFIGYSGASGYATGPHLHFGAYAQEAVKIDALPSRVCGRLMMLPLSPLNGYLNPLGYL